MRGLLGYRQGAADTPSTRAAIAPNLQAAFFHKVREFFDHSSTIRRVALSTPHPPHFAYYATSGTARRVPW